MAPQKFPPRMMATIIRHMRVRATITDEYMRVILLYMTRENVPSPISWTVLLRCRHALRTCVRAPKLAAVRRLCSADSG